MSKRDAQQEQGQGALTFGSGQHDVPVKLREPAKAGSNIVQPAQSRPQVLAAMDGCGKKRVFRRENWNRVAADRGCLVTFPRLLEIEMHVQMTRRQCPVQVYPSADGADEVVRAFGGGVGALLAWREVQDRGIAEVAQDFERTRNIGFGNQKIQIAGFARCDVSIKYPRERRTFIRDRAQTPGRELPR